MAIFGISDVDMFDKNKIKIIDSIAGAGKSSKVDAYFKQHGVNYGRYTSTNALKEDAARRYDMEVKTIASGLFHNECGRFYTDMKNNDCETTVIDELPQADPKTIEWVEEYVGTKNIIITMDSRQQLAPEQEALMSKRINALKERDDVVYVNINKTLRATNDETREQFEYWYEESAKNYVLDAADIVNNYYTIDADKVPYDETAKYCCHTDAIEYTLYKNYNLFDRYDLDVLKKGRIASRTIKDYTKYPILPQQEANATKAPAYLQIKNVGTPTRMQGQEAEVGSKFYYFIEANSKITSREFYTVITRLKDINDFVVVLIEADKKETIKTFNGLPVKKFAYLTVDFNEDTTRMKPEQLFDFVKQHDTNDTYYDRTIVYQKAKNNVIAYIADNKKVPETRKTTKPTAKSAISKDATMNFTYVGDAYRALESKGIDRIKAVQRFKQGKEKAKYFVDLNSAYPTIAKYCDMPAEGDLSLEYNPDMLNFYIYKGDMFTNGALITEALAEYIKFENLGEVEFVFATPKQKGCVVGNYAYERTHKTVEAKAEFKDKTNGFHWGYYQKRYLQKMEDCYVIRPEYKYEIFFATITSTLFVYMVPLMRALNGTKVHVDAVYFDDMNDVTADIIKSMLPDFMDWKIKEADTDITLYQTFEDLPTENQLKARREKIRRELLKNAKKA